jgi:cation diffusion facilitator family transporter
MKVRRGFQLPDEQEQLRQKAIRLEWLTIAFMISIVAVMYLVLGQSQAMKTAWIEDMLSLVPPVAFLVGTHLEMKDPNAQFPYGFFRSISIAYLLASTALLVMGAYLLIDSVLKLVSATHPSIGGVELFGQQIWLGWLMIATLIYSVIPPLVLGRKKLPLGEQLHDKVLYTDAKMNKADWLTGAAAIVGIVGIGFGIWWADAAAAAFISFDILRDGLRNTWTAVKDLVDQVPRTVGTMERAPLLDRIKETAKELDWVEDAVIQFREEGHLCTGTVFVLPRTTEGLAEKVAEAIRTIEDLDWRLYDVAVVPVSNLEDRASE